MEVIDNFLSSYSFRQIQDGVLSDAFPWFFNDAIVHSFQDSYDPKIYQFTHVMFAIEQGGITSSRYPLCDVIQQKLGVKRLDRIKLNLNTRTFFNRKTGYHNDQRSPKGEYPLHQKTAVFYLNTNNGWTEFKKGGKVKSVANRIVIFDSNLEHTGVTCTDEKRRVIVNFNYDI
tara:strand:- start:208 stop:726 length:519 start_codon:yes stop_codon:yes gene_type:complete